MPNARGTFDVTLTPQPLATVPAGAPMGRMSLAKTFHGDIQATGSGEMLSGGNPASGSAGYVVIEQLVGTVNGRSGSFLLQHSGTMDAGSYQLSVTIVPGSGSGELTGIRGAMTLDLSGGGHKYDLEYSLPA